MVPTEVESIVSTEAQGIQAGKPERGKKDPTLCPRWFSEANRGLEAQWIQVCNINAVLEMEEAVNKTCSIFGINKSLLDDLVPGV